MDNLSDDFGEAEYSKTTSSTSTNENDTTNKNDTTNVLEETKEQKIKRLKLAIFFSLGDLDTYLLNYSYVHGYTPTEEDALIYDLLVSVLEGNDKMFFFLPNVLRWYKHISTFTPEEKSKWSLCHK